jgi:hypothetical protein
MKTRRHAKTLLSPPSSRGPISHRGFAAPSHQYRVIYADPPWTFQNRSDKVTGRNATSRYDCLDYHQLATPRRRTPPPARPKTRLHPNPHRALARRPHLELFARSTEPGWYAWGRNRSLRPTSTPRPPSPPQTALGHTSRPLDPPEPHWRSGAHTGNKPFVRREPGADFAD